MGPTTSTDYLTEREAANLLRIPFRALVALRGRGEGPPYAHVTKSEVRYKRADIVAWFEHRTVSPPGAGREAER